MLLLSLFCFGGLMIADSFAAKKIDLTNIRKLILCGICQLFFAIANIESIIHLNHLYVFAIISEKVSTTIV